MINMINEITKIKHYKNPKKNKLKIHREKKSVFVQEGGLWDGTEQLVSTFYSHSFTLIEIILQY